MRSELGLPSPPSFGPHGFFTRLHAWLRRSSLDRALAAGADPGASPALGHRARVLTGESKRRRLADAVHRLREEAQLPPSPRWSSAIPINREEVVAADSLLSEIESLLREEVVYCQGVVRLERLFGDGASPVYSQARQGTLRRELEKVLAALRGRGRE